MSTAARAGLLALAAGLFALLSGTPSDAASGSETEVDLELVLAVDVSLSINAEEREIQRHGYAAALTDPAVLAAISRGLTGRIAVAILEWGGESRQRLAVPWRLIADGEDAKAVAGELLAAPSPGMPDTSISGAILAAADLFENNGFTGLRRVIDVSGDGPNNAGLPVADARDLVLASGITINGLPLMTRSGDFAHYTINYLDRYYSECVIGGPGAFTVPVTSWEEFPEAVKRKLTMEIAGTGFGDPQGDWRGRAETGLPVIRAAATPPVDCLIGERLWMQNRWRWIGEQPR